MNIRKILLTAMLEPEWLAQWRLQWRPVDEMTDESIWLDHVVYCVTNQGAINSSYEGNFAGFSQVFTRIICLLFELAQRLAQ